jgi:hypothetical protein
LLSWENVVEGEEKVREVLEIEAAENAIWLAITKVKMATLFICSSVAVFIWSLWALGFSLAFGGFWSVLFVCEGDERWCWWRWMILGWFSERDEGDFQWVGNYMTGHWCCDTLSDENLNSRSRDFRTMPRVRTICLTVW